MRHAPPTLALALLACTRNDPPDSGVVVTPDAGGDQDPMATGLDPGVCAAAVDLNAAGVTAGDTLTYQGSTAAAPGGVRRTPCQPNATGIVAMRYRVRGDHVRLRLSTDNPGGTALFDTALWVTDACAARANVLECNDDDGAAEGDREGSSTVFLRAQRQGTELVVALAGYAMARRGAVGRGRFVLSVTESPSAPLGAACDPTLAGACRRGLDCAAHAARAGTCVHFVDEREPDDDPAHAMPVELPGPVSVWASLDRPGDVDCYRFRVAAGANLFFQVGNGNGRCPWDLRADLYRAGEAAPFDGDDDTGFDRLCPRVFPEDNAGVRGMPAGAYAFCVRAVARETLVPLYVVHLAHAR